MRARIRSFKRVRSTNPVTNICEKYTSSKVEKTTSAGLFSNSVNTAIVNTSPLRVSF